MSAVSGARSAACVCRLEVAAVACLCSRSDVGTAWSYSVLITTFLCASYYRYAQLRVTPLACSRYDGRRMCVCFSICVHFSMLYRDVFTFNKIFVPSVICCCTRCASVCLETAAGACGRRRCSRGDRRRVRLYSGSGCEVVSSGHSGRRIHGECCVGSAQCGVCVST